MSNSSSKLLIALGTVASPERPRRTLEPALTKSTIRLGVSAGPRPLDLVGSRRRWEYAGSPCWKRESDESLAARKVSWKPRAVIHC